jgi:adenosine deaminase
MLQQHLLSAAVSTCLTSPLLHEKLRSVLALGTDLSVTAAQKAFHEDCERILRDSLDREEPRRFRILDIGEVLKVLWPKTMLLKKTAGSGIPFFDALSDLLFTTSHSVIHFRPDALDEYMRLSARIDPALLLCWKIARDINSGNPLTQKEVQDAIETVQPFCAPPAVAEPPYADNHVHLNGGSSEQLILMEALRGTHAATGEQSGVVAKGLATVATLGRALLLGSDQPSEREMNDLCRQAMTPWGHIVPVPRIDWSVQRALTLGQASVSLRWIKHMLAQSMVDRDLARAWLWLLLWCSCAYQDKRSGPRRHIAIFLLLGTVMRVRQDLLVDGYGLNRFLQASVNRGRNDQLTDALQKDAARRIFHGSLDCAELKVPLSMLKEPSVRAWIDRLVALHPPPAGVDIANVKDACAHWHFCLHFSRTEDRPWHMADKIAAILKSQNIWKGNPLRHDSPGEKPTLAQARLVRTLDVAGDENMLKTEVFAPALRWLRTLPRPADEKPLQLTIHAGEDYAHPLSGMRHIDETVRFCDMREGDRIGHGLALGITARQWFGEQGQALLSVEEYVDNLVWAWHFATSHPYKLPYASRIATHYEAVVRALAPHVPWLNSPVPYTDIPAMQILYDAWSMRRNCRRFALRLTPMDEKKRVAVPDWEALQDPDAAGEHVRVARKRIDWSDPDKLKKLLKTAPAQCRIQATCSERDVLQLPKRQPGLDFFIVHVIPAELEFIEALQDLLIERYRHENRLIFEVNPTSNRHIGAIGNLMDHPIFRWDPPDPGLLASGEQLNRFSLRKGRLDVCVNTDDPGIMPTTLRTEFTLLRHAALDRGFASHVVDAWLERLRLQGHALFESCHL